MTISEKVAYLKGLCEGLGLDTEKSKEAKLISVMIGILEEIALSVEDLEENALALGEEIDALSDDLESMEQVFHDDHDGCGCGCEEELEIDCSNCGEIIKITDEMLELGQLYCKSCDAHFLIDLSEDTATFQMLEDEALEDELED